MRVQLLFISLFVVLAQLQATDLKAQRMSLHANGQPLQQVLKEIRKETGYDFVYSPETLKAHARPVRLQADNMAVADLLKLIFETQSRLQYTIDQKTVIVRPKKEYSPSGKIELKQYRDPDTQEWIIEGVVLDEDTKEPIEGVTVELEEQGLPIRTQSDRSGRFRIVVPKL